MKRFISIILVLALCCALLSAIVVAEELSPEMIEGDTEVTLEFGYSYLNWLLVGESGTGYAIGYPSGSLTEITIFDTEE